MRANQADYGVQVMARTLGVSRSGFYACGDRGISQRRTEDQRLLRAIRRIHCVSRGTYGSPRIPTELGQEGWRVGRKRVERLMREHGIQGISRRPTPTTTVRQARVRPAPDLVQRQFCAEQPNRLWVADITYIPTWAGFVYLAVVLDVYSRRVVGWALREDRKTELVIEALNRAVEHRKPRQVIHHSDQGSQYTSLAFVARCQHTGVRVSMGSVGDA